MKGKLIAWTLVLIAAMAIVGVALACPPEPQEPTCPEGQITVTPAVWVPEVPATDGHCYVVVQGQDMSQYYKHDGNSANCSLKHGESWRHFFWPFPPQTAQGTWVPGTPAIPGYWIPPVCRDPILGCTDPLALNYNPAAEVDDGSCEYPYVPCSQTVEGQAPDTTYGPWSECVDESQSREVTTWSVPLLDSQDPQVVCVPSVPTVGTEYQSCEMPPVDVCPNLEGLQTEIPEGYMLDEQGNCVLIPPEVCEDEAALNYGQPLPCLYPPPPPSCDGRVWVWHLQGQDGLWHTLRDRGYDGTYSAPGLAIQRYYFGCDWYPMPNVWGEYVTCFEPDYDYWMELPCWAGGGQCSLP